MKDHRFFPLILASLAALAPFSVDAYLPAIPAIAADFQEPINLVQLSISVFLVGFAVGQILGGPLSDALGRRPIALAGVCLYLLATIPIITSDSYRSLLPLRALQAVGSGMAAVIPAAIVRDLFHGKEVARVLAFIAFMMLGAPLVAPMIGAFLLETFDWHAIFVFLTAYGCICLLITLSQIKETRQGPRVSVRFGNVLLNYASVLGQKQAIVVIVPIALSFAVMFSFLTNSSFVYIEYFGIPQAHYPFYFGVNVAVMIFWNRMNPLLLKRYESANILQFGFLLQLLAGVFLLAVTLLHGPIAVFVAGVAMMVGSLGLIMPNGMSCCLAMFPEKSGTMAAVIGTLNFTVGGLIGSLTTAFHSHSEWPMVGAMVVCTLLAAVIFFSGFKPARA